MSNDPQADLIYALLNSGNTILIRDKTEVYAKRVMRWIFGLTVKGPWAGGRYAN